MFVVHDDERRPAGQHYWQYLGNIKTKCRASGLFHDTPFTRYTNESAPRVVASFFSSLNAKRREFYCRAAIKCQRNSQGNFLYSNIRSSYYQSVLALVDGHANNSIRRVIICKTGSRYRREACASHYVDFTIQNDSYLYELSYCS